MKLSRLQPSSIPNPALVVALAVTAATTLRSQPQITAAQLANLTSVALTNCISPGNYYFLLGPNPVQPWPPLPAPPPDLPGETPVYDLGGNYFLIDDSAVDWDAIWQQREIDSALNDLEIQYGLRAGPAGGGILRPMDMSSYTEDDLYLLVPVFTNNTAWLSLHPPTSEVANGSAVNDLYTTTSPSPEGEGLNLTNWMWVLRTDPPGQTEMLVSDLWEECVCFRLGRTNSTAGDGISDAFKLLVSHTDVNTPQGPFIFSQPLSGKLEHVRAARLRTLVGSLDRTLAVVESEELLAGQKRCIAVALRKAKVELRKLKRLAQAGRLRRERLEERCQKALAREHLSSFVVATIGGSDPKPTFEWRVDAALRRQLENTRLGQRVLCTDRHHWSTGRIVHAFRGQWNVEELFRRAKKGGVVPWGPSHQWADGSLRLHT
jgi:hypothetical protein